MPIRKTSVLLAGIILENYIKTVSCLIASCIPAFLVGCSPTIKLETTPEDIIQVALDSCAYNNQKLVGSCIGGKLQNTDHNLAMNKIRILCKNNMRHCLLTYKTISTVEYGADIYKKNEIWYILLQSAKDDPQLDQLKFEAKLVTSRMEGGM